MKKPVFLVLIPVLLGFFTLSGCAEKDGAQSKLEPSPGSGVTQNIRTRTGEGALTFYSPKELEAAILTENADEIYGGNIAAPI